MPSITPLILRGLLALAAAAALIVLLQNFLIFPRLAASLQIGPETQIGPTPAGVESFFLPTSDGERLEVWKLGRGESTRRPRVAVMFTGNSAGLGDLYSTQAWFRSVGVTSYSLSYRGIDRSTGWPSQSALYRDARELWEHVRRAESIEPAELIVLGYSLGTGIASHLATEVEPGALLLFSPYTSFPDIVGEIPLYRYLTPFLAYDLPVADNLRVLNRTRVFVAHGDQDTVIPVSHSRRLETQFGKQPGFTFWFPPRATHFDIIGNSMKLLEESDILR